MKLFAKYNRLTIPASVLVFVVGSCTFYFVLRYILVHQMDLNLQMEREEIEMEVKEDGHLPEELTFNQLWVAYVPMDNPPPTEYLSTKERHEQEEVAVRQLKFPITAGGRSYQVILSTPLEHTVHLLNLIIVVTIIMIALILVVTFLINRNLVGRLWKPFYETIDHTGQYDLTSDAPINLGQTDIEEFTLLNQSINKMTARAQQEYLSLKEFTMHAAHEMQTPLSVMRMKLDNLLQDEAGMVENAEAILELERSISKLSKLNRSLLLLTKVENQQFVLNETVKLDELVQSKCEEFAEMIESKGLACSVNVVPVSITFHQHLAEIVVNNLLANAIQYNKPGGTIQVALSADALELANTSPFGQLDEGKVFHRFYRQNSAEGEGNGLGLSIIKQICDFAGYPVSYTYHNQQHMFRVGLR